MQSSKLTNGCGHRDKNWGGGGVKVLPAFILTWRRGRHVSKQNSGIALLDKGINFSHYTEG